MQAAASTFLAGSPLLSGQPRPTVGARRGQATVRVSAAHKPGCWAGAQCSGLKLVNARQPWVLQEAEDMLKQCSGLLPSPLLPVAHTAAACCVS